jgi:hypothetical protein
MRTRRSLGVLGTVLAVACSAPSSAWAQVTTREGLTLSELIQQLTFSQQLLPPGTNLGADIIEFGTALEVGSYPIGGSAGSFLTKLDPATGMQARLAKTFGPAFAQRALTSGEGKVAVGGNFIYSTYDKFGKLDLDHMRLLRSKAAAGVTTDGITSLAITSKTLLVSGTAGVTDNLDVNVVVPLVTVKVEGISWMCTGTESNLNADPRCTSVNNKLTRQRAGTGVSSGIGDIAVQLKYRFLKFGEGAPDPGGITALVSTRLPTGDRENLRGLGINRTLVSLIASWGKGPFNMHGNAGFEVWSNAVEILGDPIEETTVKARHQVEYAGGVEFAAAPKLTLLLDLLGRHTLDAGKMGFETAQVGGSTLEYAVGSPHGNFKLTLAPGLKLNVKGKMLVSLNALVHLKDGGLYDKFTPVAAVELNF